MIHSHTQQSGFTLMIAVLIAGLLTSLGIAMYNIADKELTLSSIGRDSQYAFYAADAGSECALYWAYKGGFDENNPMRDAVCNGQKIGQYVEGVSVDENDIVIGGAPVTEFEFEMATGTRQAGCIKVYVDKNVPNKFIRILSRGYNMRCGSANSARRLERAVEIEY